MDGFSGTRTSPIPSGRRPCSPPVHHPIKRRRDASTVNASMGGECTIGGHLDAPNHLRCVLANMVSDPQLHSLCDVVLVVEGEKFPAHRAVLAAVSNVFKAMFTNSMKERNAPEIVLRSLDKRAWRMAMKYIYHAQLDIHDEPTALLLLATARMYQLERLEHFVESFLITRVCIQNCFSLLHQAQQFDLDALESACYRMMESNFEALAMSPAFEQCPFRLISKIVSSGALLVKTEAFVFEAILRWTNANEKERLRHLDELLSYVRLQNFSDLQLARIGRSPTIFKSIKFQRLIFERLTRKRGDSKVEGALESACYLKPHRRDTRVFTFSHVQRAVTKMPPADEEEIVRTPWALDEQSGILWRLKIYPRGYCKAKDLFLSMYVQARSGHSTKLDLKAKFDIFLINRNDPTQTIIFSSSHHFTEASDHWGFHRFLQLTQLQNHSLGFLEEETDSLLLGATLYMPLPESIPSPSSTEPCST